MLLARQAVLLDNSSATAGTLLATLLRDPAVISTFALPITARPQRIVLRPDGRQLAVSDNNNDVRFFDTMSHRESRSPLADHGHLGLGGGPLYAGADFIAAHLPAGNSPPSLDVFDAQTLHLVRTLQLSPDWLNRPTGPFNPLFASADGRTLYFAWTLVNRDQSDGAAFIDSWDIASGAHRLVPLDANGMSGAVALSQNRVLVVTDTAAISLDGDTLRPVRSVPIHIGSAAVTPNLDGTALAVVAVQHGAPVNTFSLLDLTSGRSTPAAGSHAAAILTLAFTPDGRSIITSGDDGKVILWNAATLSPTETFSGHSARVLDQALSADGSTLYTASLDGVIFAWDLGGAARFGHPFTFSVSPQEETGFFKPPLAVSPDSAQFAARIAPGQVGVLSVRTAHQEKVITTSPGADVTALAWSTNQQIAVSGAQGVELWDAHGTPRLAQTLAGIQGSAQAIAFTPDGNTVAAVTIVPPPPDSQTGPDGWLGVWDVRSGSLRASQHIGTDGWSVAFDPAARLLAVGTEDGRVLVVDAATGQTQRTLHPMGPASPVPSVSFRADGVLVTGSWAGIVEHWNAQTGDQLAHAVHVASAPVSSLAFGPAGGTFATTGGSSGGTSIWDEPSLQQFGATFPGGTGVWGNALYTPDGSNLVVVYGDGSGAIWPVSMSAWLDHACAVAQRNFTSEEWARFVPDHDYTQTCPAFPAG